MICIWYAHSQKIEQPNKFILLLQKKNKGPKHDSQNRFRTPMSESDLITFKCNRLHYNYFAIFMITITLRLHQFSNVID